MLTFAKYCSFSGHAHEQVRQMERRKELSEPARLNFPKSQALDFHSLLKAQLRRWSVSSHRVHVSMSHISSHSGHYHTLHEWVFGDTWRYGQTWVLFDYSAPTGDPNSQCSTGQGARRGHLSQSRPISRRHLSGYVRNPQQVDSKGDSWQSSAT